ncbi:MAG: YeaH/YhbH family protein, partial [Rubrivivax sp.]
MQQIIDRRLAGKNKSIGNRERFLRRHKEQIRGAVKRAIDGRGIRDVERGDEVRIPKKDLNEPVFGHGQGGSREMVHPGNRDYLTGDRIERPKGGGGGGGGGQASDQGDDEDDFVFALSREEFMQVFFEDLALPHLIRTQLAETPEWKSQRAGYSSDGTPNNLHVVRSMRGALGRRIALGAGSRQELLELHEQLEALERAAQPGDAVARAEIDALIEQIAKLRAKVERIPYLDPIDLRYRSRVRVPVPTSKAVMFCLMDVSGSMDEGRKDLSKRFFILLYLFLTRHYEKIDLVFIRHHTQAQEVDEQNFFHARETGGTVVSSALVLMEQIIRERYDPAQWNIYGAQASDGDNWHHDSGRCRELLNDKLLPL